MSNTSDNIVAGAIILGALGLAAYSIREARKADKADREARERFMETSKQRYSQQVQGAISSFNNLQRADKAMNGILTDIVKQHNFNSIAPR